MNTQQTSVHIDGAARGNPGPAAYGVVIATPGQPVIEEAEVLGHATNNVAEYTALVRALERCRDLGLKKLRIHSDSELLVKQMNGIYKVKNADLKALFDEAKELLRAFATVTIIHVRRELNKRADELGNLALDGKPVLRGGGAPPPAEPQDDFNARCIVSLEAARDAWTNGETLTPEVVWEWLRQILIAEGVIETA